MAGDGEKVTLGMGTKDMQMRSWRWEKAPTLSGEACTAAQRRLAEKEKMGLQRANLGHIDLGQGDKCELFGCLLMRISSIPWPGPLHRCLPTSSGIDARSEKGHDDMNGFCP